MVRLAARRKSSVHERILIETFQGYPWTSCTFASGELRAVNISLQVSSQRQYLMTRKHEHSEREHYFKRTVQRYTFDERYERLAWYIVDTTTALLKLWETLMKSNAALPINRSQGFLQRSTVSMSYEIITCLSSNQMNRGPRNKK